VNALHRPSARRHSSAGAWIAVALFLCVDLAQTTNKVAIHSDSMWSLHLAVSVLRQRNLDLDEYRSQVQGAGFYGTDSIGGHLYSYFPVGPSLAVLPLVAVADAVCRLVHVDLAPILTGPRSARAESHIAAFVVALTTVVLYAAFRLAAFDAGTALITALMFAFCTSVWSTASRALWQHGPSMLALSAALYLLMKPHATRRTTALLGVVLACAWIIRPTNAISLLVLTALVIHRRGRGAVGLLAGVLPLGAFFILNLRVWHFPIPPYFHPSRIGIGQGSMLEALAGDLVSPARGLFVFSPVLLVAVYGMVTGLRNRLRRDLNRALVAIIVLHWFVIASFPHWWGGHSYGPRLFTDMMPYFAYFFAVAMTGLQRFRAWPRRAAWVATALLAAMSFWIHCRGANSYPVHWWNSQPTNVDLHPERLWQWSDLQFLR
jgi:hypothetical protein